MTRAGLEWPVLLVAAAAAILVALAGGLLTVAGPRSRALRRPAWRPPDWAFGPIWAVIFALITVSGTLAWSAAADAGGRATLVAAYAVNGVLNIAWSGLFFRAERPDWALVDIVLLGLSIVGLILASLPLSPKAALLLLPYLGWVGVAACLNLAIVRLNRPFGRA
ncbi:TspO/MBR family protein [Methylobacterium durans]|uniref:TspO/MBR family protein n=1 Tax=Methylobacterium durans TaxID=2202825 RepID=UPI002AFF2C8E|nr:TspO/MBR family protein [Methylobacterium durans]MEA1830698.1 TspO/MBR family protein [Methylobacterium durans]